MLKPELEERSFGSNYDPILNGVAHGLGRLFPPVGIARGERSGQVAASARSAEVDTGSAQERATQRKLGAGHDRSAIGHVSKSRPNPASAAGRSPGQGASGQE